MEEQQKIKGCQSQRLSSVPLKCRDSPNHLPKSREHTRDFSPLPKQGTPGKTAGGKLSLSRTPSIKWIGRASAGRDVSIRLVTDEPKPHRRETVAVVKVHSQVLSTYSKYFQACLSERWAPNSSSDASSDFALEVQADVEVYFDCFSRMDSPLLKNFQIIRDFRDVKSSLELLKVASRIEFHELMESISRYLSSVRWSTEDEIRIREYSSSPGFSRRHAEDLVERLGLDESEEDRHKRLCDVMQRCVRTALSRDSSFAKCSRAFLTELLQGIGSATPSTFARMVVMMVNREAKDMFHEVENECQGKEWLQVPHLYDKLRAMWWVLDAVLTTQVAEDLVQCFAHLDAVGRSIGISRSSITAPEVAKLVVRIYEGVVTGHFLLKTPAKVALLANWHPVLGVLGKDVYDEPTKQLFLTLPPKNQMELIKLRQEKFDDYISTSSLISTLSKGCNWQAIKLNLDALYPEDS